jgi:LacI family transcriptional regulator
MGPDMAAERVRHGDKAVTLSDVAHAAGVSVATASKALNGRDRVKAATRERVMEAAARLGFAPNRTVPGVLAGKTGTVALLTSDLEGRFSLPILMGAEDAFGSGKTAVFLCDARGDSIREQYYIETLLSRRVDGFIIVGTRTDPRPSVGQLPVPVVYAYAPSDNPDDTSFVSDDRSGARLAVEHLVASGRRRIAHVTGEFEFKAAKDRAQGVADGLASFGLELAGGSVRFGSWDEAWGRGAARALIESDPEIDAIVCGSDVIARGVIDAMVQSGRDVPRDVAVIGFDNWDVVVSNARPRLTSIDLGLEELGRRAARKLFDGIDGSMTRGIEQVSCRLVTRESSTISS